MARKPAQDKWDAANMASQNVRVRRELLENFKAACVARGDAVNGVLRQAMIDYINATPTVADEMNDQTLSVIGQLAADVEDLRAIYLCETVDDETRKKAAANAEHVLDLIQRITAADGSEQRKNSE